jgi:nicotinamide mononucleotide transporter
VPLETIAAITGGISVWLSTRENILSWPTALINVALYTVVFYEARLYADMGLQVIYFALSVYGWYEWLHGGANRTELHVTRTPRRRIVTLGLIGLAGALALGTILGRLTNAAQPMLDSTLSSFSLVAQYMMTRKYLENWALWIALDVVYVGMFIYKSLPQTAVLYAVFLVLAVMGHMQWKKALLARTS